MGRLLLQGHQVGEAAYKGSPENLRFRVMRMMAGAGQSKQGHLRILETLQVFHNRLRGSYCGSILCVIP